MAKRVDISGQTFGNLSAIRPVGLVDNRTHWLCECVCGKQSQVSVTKLRGGHTRSCGCLRAETVRQIRTQHGRSKTQTYSSWQNMISRCTNPTSAAYDHYQRRGITVCDRWRSFDNFLADMGERPGGKREYTLERVDNDRNYEPGNCEWATWSVQAKNRTDNSGERNPAAKLTNEQVVAILADTRRQHIIAAEYGVRQQQISRIKSGKRRRNG